jgi:hypothetical protein
MSTMLCQQKSHLGFGRMPRLGKNSIRSDVTYIVEITWEWEGKEVYAVFATKEIDEIRFKLECKDGLFAKNLVRKH